MVVVVLTKPTLSVLFASQTWACESDARESTASGNVFKGD